jgi:hypothetical protein
MKEGGRRMEASDLENMRAVLCDLRSTRLEELADLDAAVARLDALIEAEAPRLQAVPR